MGRPDAAFFRRESSNLHYQTFPTPPPKNKGQPPSNAPPPNGINHVRSGSTNSLNGRSPLPIKQLIVLAIFSLSEQTALNSISPYLPQMVSSFKDVDEGQVGLYVGLVASSFALAQFATNFFWGWISDRIGRKPVMLTGTLFTAACFIAFGFCKTFWQAVLVQVFMGLVNGNQGVVSTCLGEITDRSNQSKAFVYLPVIYGLGGITGPVLGGLLVSEKAHFSETDPYPFKKPNLASAAVLILDLFVAMFFLEESLEEAKNLPPLGQRVGNLFSWLWQFTSSSRPSYLRLPASAKSQQQSHDRIVEEDGDTDSESGSGSLASLPAFVPHNSDHLTQSQVLNRDILLLLTTYLVFQLANISFNSLYPIFGQAPPPTGRNLSPGEIGFSLGFAGAVTIAFQLGFFGRLRERLGNRVTYRGCLAAMAISYILIPWVGYKEPNEGNNGMSSGKVWLWIELGFVLLVKSLAAVGCLTSFLLLLTNSAPNHNVLGTLNGLAQTLSAAGRATGPFLAGGLFSLSTHVEPKGEALAFGVFGGITFIGFLLSFGIRGKNLEAEWDDEEQRSENDDDYGNEEQDER